MLEVIFSELFLNYEAMVKFPSGSTHSILRFFSNRTYFRLQSVPLDASFFFFFFLQQHLASWEVSVLEVNKQHMRKINPTLSMGKDKKQYN